LYPDVIGGVPFRKNTFNPADLAQYEQNMILATYSEGEVSLGYYLQGTATWNDKLRPPFYQPDSLKMAVFRLQLDAFLYNEAKEMGLEDSPDYLDAMSFFKDQLLAAKMREIVALEKSFVNEEDIAQYYDDHKSDYISPRKLHIQEIHVDTEADANKMHNRLKNGENFEKLAEKNTVRPGMQVKKGNLGFIAEYQYPTLFKEAERLHSGEYSEPFPIGDRWSIVKLLDFQQPEIKELESVASQIKKQLETIRREEGLKEYMVTIKDNYSIKADYDLIWETIDESKYE